MNTPIGYYIIAGIAPASGLLVALIATYAQRRQTQIERNRARKTTTQQNRTNPK